MKWIWMKHHIILRDICRKKYLPFFPICCCDLLYLYLSIYMFHVNICGSLSHLITGQCKKLPYKQVDTTQVLVCSNWIIEGEFLSGIEHLEWTALGAFTSG